MPTLPNLNIETRRNADGSFICYVITVVSDDYVIHDRSGDFNGPGPDGNPVYEPYYTYGPSFIMNENYDWETNPDGIEAVLISELPPGTFIAAKPNEPEHEVM